MIIVDAHCDTITKIMETNEGLKSNTCHIDIERMKRYKGFVQFFAAFIDPVFGGAYAMRRALSIIDRFYKEVELNSSEIEHCCNSLDIKQALAAGKVAAILSIEGGDALQGDLAALRMFYKLGVRSICLTWNHRNEIADGVADETTGGGLTPFGRNVISEMNRLGMLIDLSHIAEKGFWDVLEMSTAPLICSHSNAKAICKHRRNLTNEQILAIKKIDGVIGINLYPSFLNDDGSASQLDILRHIEHIVSVSGLNHIGLGADFDGIEKTPIDILGVQDLEILIDSLLQKNYPEDFVRKFLGDNLLRIIQAVIK